MEKQVINFPYFRKIILKDALAEKKPSSSALNEKVPRRIIAKHCTQQEVKILRDICSKTNSKSLT